jgi:hypothetical protein
MDKRSTTTGALAIMAGSGAIADFELIESGDELLVRVWPPQERDASRLRKQVAAMLPREIEERHVVIVE